MALLCVCMLSAHGQDSTGWKAPADLVAAKSKQNRGNYEEAKVPQYNLPDPLVMVDGTKVTTPELWRSRRRPEILELFRSQVYGRAPGKPENMTFECFDLDENALGGKAIRKQVTVYFDGKKDGPSMDILLYIPKGAAKPVPAFTGLNFNANMSINADPAIRLSTRWARDKKEAGVVDHHFTEASRGTGADRWPVDLLLESGYALVTAYYGDIDPDFDDGFENGVQGYFDTFPKDQRPADAWGSISAWAWGLSRIVDYLETDPDVDATKVSVLGHSRLGKTALWAGAQDERFAIVISNCSGCGGAALSRRAYGETVERINTSFPHWFCGNFKQYNSNESALPVDQHMLIALVAPRPVYVCSANEDLWADPKGEFLAALNADPVYKLLGKKGLPVKSMPAMEHPVLDGTIGHHVCAGPHALNVYSWEQYIKFADKHLK